MGEHLERIIPLIVNFCRVEDDELREYCLQAFESFRAPVSETDHTPHKHGKSPGPKGAFTLLKRILGIFS